LHMQKKMKWKNNRRHWALSQRIYAWRAGKK